MQTIVAEPLLDPQSTELQYLPEGPISSGADTISWVAIQHGTGAEQGSLNELNLAEGANKSWLLPGRPGFAFPTTREGVYLLGLERHIQQLDTSNGEIVPVSGEVDTAVEGTIINDGIAFPEGIVFGTKDLQFAEKKAGLYFWRADDQRIFPLRDDQICSNGKVIRRIADTEWQLLDIDTPTQTVVEYQLDTEAGTVSAPRVVLDLTDLEIFPDGMVATADGASVIIAFYNPQDAPHGIIRQYRLDDGEVEIEWQVPGSPQVTCPLLLERAGAVNLVVTTAAENMSAEKIARYPRAGWLFTAPTPHAVAPVDYRLSAQ